MCYAIFLPEEKIMLLILTRKKVLFMFVSLIISSYPHIFVVTVDDYECVIYQSNLYLFFILFHFHFSSLKKN